MPLADISSAANCCLFDHLVRARRQCRRHLEAERLGGAQVDHELELGPLRDRQVGRLRALEDTAGVNTALTIGVGEAGAGAHEAAGPGERAAFVGRWRPLGGRAASTTSCSRRLLKKGDAQTSSAPAPCCVSVANAAFNSPSTLARRTTNCTPRLVAASRTSCSWVSAAEKFGWTSTATVVALGTISCSSPSRFASSPVVN